MKTTKLEHMDICPYCNYLLDTASAGPENPDATPEPGDATFCINCAGALVFGDALRLRKPTTQELAEIAADPQSAIVVAAIVKLGRTRHT